MGLCCATQKNVPSHIITKKFEDKKNQKKISAHIVKKKFEDKNKIKKWLLRIKSIFIKLQKNKLLTKSGLAHNIIFFIKMVFYQIISWKISVKLRVY